MNVTLYEGYAGQPDYSCSFYTLEAFESHLQTLISKSLNLENVYSRFEGSFSITFSETQTFYPNYMVEFDENGNYIRSWFVTRCDKINDALIVDYTIDVWMSYLPNFTTDGDNQPWKFLEAYRTLGGNDTNVDFGELPITPQFGIYFPDIDFTNFGTNGYKYYIVAEIILTSPSTGSAIDRFVVPKLCTYGETTKGSSPKLFTGKEIMSAVSEFKSLDGMECFDTQKGKTYLNISRIFVLQSEIIQNSNFVTTGYFSSNDKLQTIESNYTINGSNPILKNVYETYVLPYSDGKFYNAFGTLNHHLPIKNTFGEHFYVYIEVNSNCSLSIFLSGGGAFLDVSNDFIVETAFNATSDLVAQTRQTAYDNALADALINMQFGTINQISKKQTVESTKNFALNTLETGVSLFNNYLRFENDEIYPGITSAGAFSWICSGIGFQKFTGIPQNLNEVLNGLNMYGYKCEFLDIEYPKKFSNNSKSVFLQYKNLILYGKIPNQHLKQISNILETGIRLWCDNTLGFSL